MNDRYWRDISDVVFTEGVLCPRCHFGHMIPKGEGRRKCNRCRHSDHSTKFMTEEERMAYVAEIRLLHTKEGIEFLQEFDIKLLKKAMAILNYKLKKSPLSMEQIAKRVDNTRNFRWIYKWVSKGDVTPKSNANILAKLCVMFGVSVREMVDICRVKHWDRIEKKHNQICKSIAMKTRQRDGIIR